MAHGTVKWFNTEKGYGFIAQDGGAGDVFVHYSEIVGHGIRTLEENQRVEFEVGQGGKGPQAHRVRALVGGPAHEVHERNLPRRQTSPRTGGTRGSTGGPSAVEFGVQIYLESADGAAEVDESVLGILRELGAEIGYRPPPVLGSWFRRFRVKIETAVTSDQFADLARRVERSLELKAIDAPQAAVDSAQAGAAADLIRSLESQRNALVQIGSLLLVKIDGDLIVRNLTQHELAFIQKNPSSAANAKEILDRLQGLSAEEVRTAALDRPPGPVLPVPGHERGTATLTGRVWVSGNQRSLAVTNAGAVPVRNVRAVVESPDDRHRLRISEEDMLFSLLLPGQSAMLELVGSGSARPVSVALRGEGPVGEAVECIVQVDF
ncbi:hypothetical protein GCM10017567_08060 [Amycolatopsis bullii]|uniref:CSD domain-containing protein n=1 Tax=Amycolatopsis bullii TaxID=941987 RepID=A0ABQ3JZY1_9PSEU|nr:hypothetical protein GCM10017567_08060 [Amycolatopsis bullii]